MARIVNFPQLKQQRVHIRRGDRCRFCEVMYSTSHIDRVRTIDHIRPKSLGGSNLLHNLRTICRRCNEQLGALGNCIGALACVWGVIGKVPTSEVVHHWRNNVMGAARSRIIYNAARPQEWCA